MQFRSCVKQTLIGCVSLGLCALPVWSFEKLKNTEQILLNVRTHGMEPVAICSAQGNFRELPAETEIDAIQELVQAYFVPDKRFDLIQNGLIGKQLKVSEFFPPGCSGFGFIAGTIEPEAKQIGSRFLTFSSGGFGDTTKSNSFEPDQRQKNQLIQLVRNTYSQRGLSEEALEGLTIDEIQGFRLSKGKVPVLAVASRVFQGNALARLCHSDYLLLLAEPEGQELETKLELFKSDTQAEGECSGYNFVSSFRLGSDSDYLLFEGWGYEWNWYEIYRRTLIGTYEQEFDGGGGGC